MPRQALSARISASIIRRTRCMALTARKRRRRKSPSASRRARSWGRRYPACGAGSAFNSTPWPAGPFLRHQWPGGRWRKTLKIPAAERTAQALKRVRGEPLALRDFLKRMPKGADLHSHLSGAIYAETHIRDAIEDGLCVDQDAKAFAKSQPVIAGAELQPICEEDQVPASELPKNQRLYNGLVDSFAMRGFVPSEGVTAHDHFFDAFVKFG